MPLGALRAMTELRKMLGDWEVAAIVSARAKGATWRDIADALGITRQALQQRIARAAGDTAPGKTGDAPRPDEP